MACWHALAPQHCLSHTVHFLSGHNGEALDHVDMIDLAMDLTRQDSGSLPVMFAFLVATRAVIFIPDANAYQHCVR